MNKNLEQRVVNDKRGQTSSTPLARNGRIEAAETPNKAGINKDKSTAESNQAASRQAQLEAWEKERENARESAKKEVEEYRAKLARQGDRVYIPLNPGETETPLTKTYENLSKAVKDLADKIAQVCNESPDLVSEFTSELGTLLRYDNGSQVYTVQKNNQGEKIVSITHNEGSIIISTRPDDKEVDEAEARRLIYVLETDDSAETEYTANPRGFASIGTRDLNSDAEYQYETEPMEVNAGLEKLIESIREKIPS